MRLNTRKPLHTVKTWLAPGANLMWELKGGPYWGQVFTWIKLTYESSLSIANSVRFLSGVNSKVGNRLNLESPVKMLRKPTGDSFWNMVNWPWISPNTSRIKSQTLPPHFACPSFIQFFPTPAPPPPPPIKKEIKSRPSELLHAGLDCRIVIFTYLI